MSEYRCRYEDCSEGHPVAGEADRVTCSTCRMVLGLPQLEQGSSEDEAPVPMADVEREARIDIARILGTIHPVTGVPLGHRADLRALSRLIDAHRAECVGAAPPAPTSALQRLEADLRTLGFAIWDTGGGNTAWGLALSENRQLLITAHEELSVPLESEGDTLVDMCVNSVEEDGSGDCEEQRGGIEFEHVIFNVNEMLRDHRDTPKVHALEKGLKERGFSLESEHYGTSWVRRYADKRFMTVYESEGASDVPTNDTQMVSICVCAEDGDIFDSTSATLDDALSTVDRMLNAWF